MTTLTLWTIRKPVERITVLRLMSQFQRRPRHQNQLQLLLRLPKRLRLLHQRQNLRRLQHQPQTMAELADQEIILRYLQRLLVVDQAAAVEFWGHLVPSASAADR